MAKISMKSARVNALLTQQDMANLMEVSRDSIHKWESGKSKIGIPQFAMFCRLCQMQEDDIFLPINSTKSR